jgi:chemotaxis protein MotB
LRKRKVDRISGNGSNSAGWLTTFNDLLTQLMVFFVLLFTMSTIDTKKMKDFQYALQSGFGILSEGSKASISVKASQPIADLSHVATQAESQKASADAQITAHTIEPALETFAAEPGIHVTYSNQGTRITFEDCLLFDFGRADISPSGFFFLKKVAGLISKVPYPVRVEGHTDNVSIHTQRFPSNWELSTSRAVNVVKFLADVGNINPQRLSAVGYGESRPIDPNDSPANRAKNRRVEIVLVTEGEK